jgi:hypothetical protein
MSKKIRKKGAGRTLKSQSGMYILSMLLSIALSVFSLLVVYAIPFLILSEITIYFYLSRLL